MRLDGLLLDDDFVSRLLQAAEADPALIASPAGRREAVGALALYALEQLAEGMARGETPSIDRPHLEELLADLAGRARELELDLDRRGVAAAIWTERGDWQSLDAAPRRALEADMLADRLDETARRHPDARVVLSQRLLGDGSEATAVTARGIEGEELLIDVELRGIRHRLRIDPRTVTVIGILTEEPEPLADARGR